MEQSVHGAITSVPDAANVTNAQPTYAEERPGAGLIAWLLIALLFDIAIAAIVLSVVVS